MDINTIRNISEADKVMASTIASLLANINALAEIAGRNPHDFYLAIGQEAATRQAQHRQMIQALQALSPEAISLIKWPKREVIYLADGSAYPTDIPFDYSRETLTAANYDQAVILEQSILASLPTE